MKNAVLCCGLIVLGCSTSAGGPEYVEFGVGAIEFGGDQYPLRCTPMPVMPGGHTVLEVSFDGAFSARLDAMRHQVDVTFSGINVPEVKNRSIPRAAMEDGYAETDLEIETLEGRQFTVLLATCSSSTTMP
jgi:hypothetical protein